MAIEGFTDKISFSKKLGTVVSATRPILSIEHLKGRDEELERIEKALLTPGQNVFIYGERGVGKSSLAATAANQWQSSDASYIDISCSPDTTIATLVSSIVSSALNSNRIENIKKIEEAKISFKFLSYSLKTEKASLDLSQAIKHTHDAIEILREVSELHSDETIIVVDEVDRIKNATVIEGFADLLKQLGDKRVDLKFIFTGVGTSLDQILGSHQSAIRQLETIELPRLSWNARWDIAIEALGAFNIKIPKSIYIRIAGISDGYPYYVHLITKQLLWLLFEHPDTIKEVTWDHYYEALDKAINSITAELARPYNMAVNRENGGYEEILWATSADEWQGAFLSDMHKQYENIITQLPDRKALARNQFSNRIRNLLKPSFGEILIKGERKGFYHYKEKMLRGYIRMQAEAKRINIIDESQKNKEKTYMHAPAKSPKNYQSSPPKTW